MSYFIKPNGSLGYSTVESTNTGNDRRAEYETDGYRSVDEFEFTIAQLVTRYNAKRILRMTKRLAEEMGEEID